MLFPKHAALRINIPVWFGIYLFPNIAASCCDHLSFFMSETYVRYL